MPYPNKSFHLLLQEHKKFLKEFDPVAARNGWLGKFPVPADIYKIVDSNNPKLEFFQDSLTADNYSIKLRNLLYLEEAHQSILMRCNDRRHLDCEWADEGEAKFKLDPEMERERRSRIIIGNPLVIRKDQLSKWFVTNIDIDNSRVYIERHRNRRWIELKGVDIFFLLPRAPYIRCHEVLENFMNSPLLRNIVFPAEGSLTRPRIHIKPGEKFITKQLDYSQKKAVTNILRCWCRPAPYILFGPPGTGKTHTLIAAILEVYNRIAGSNILVCSNSNECVDNLAWGILKTGAIPSNMLLRIMAFRLKNDIPEFLKSITRRADDIDDCYDERRVILATCIQSGAFQRRKRFDYVFIDEAGYANEPETLIPISLVKQDGCTVLAGDPKQLKPVCMNMTAARGGLSNSLLVRLCEHDNYRIQVQGRKKFYRKEYITQLEYCYRSDARLLAINNERFYNNKLKCRKKTPKKILDIFGLEQPLAFNPVRGNNVCYNKSWCNEAEVQMCVRTVRFLYRNGIRPYHIGIISIYRLQADKLIDAFQIAELPLCKIGTTEEYQGAERNIIIITTAKTNLDRNLGFLQENERFNVATSRAKQITLLVGHEGLLTCTDSPWKEFIAKSNMPRLP